MAYLAPMLHTALAPAVAGEREDRPVFRYALRNGLDVVLVPDRRVPKVALNLSYKVGSVNEPPGRSGFAHLFEHLMFSGTPAYPNIDETYGALGITSNAFTGEDSTVYHAEGLSASLPVMLSVEADRMANQGAAITVEDLDLQRAVVLNEMRENVLDYVTGAGWEAMRAALFPPGHPYSRAVIGSMADLADARIEDVLRFFDAHYTPNNAILVIAGDFEVEDVRGMIADTFGRVPRGPDVARVSPVEIEPRRLRLEFEDGSPTPVVVLGWAVPAFGSPELGAIRIAGELLGDPDSGLLHKALVDTGLAATAYAWHEPGQLASRFFVYASACDGTDTSSLEAAMRSALAAFVASPIEPSDLARAKRRLLLNDKVSAEPLHALAGHVAVATNILGRPEAALKDDPAVLVATPESVLDTTARRLDPEEATAMLIRPGDRGGYPEVLTSSTGVPRPIAAPRRSGVDIPPLAAREPAVAAPPAFETAVLRSGMRIVHYPMPHASLMHVAAVSSAGALSAPEGREGIVELATMLATRGAGGLDRDAFGKALKDLGASLSWQVEASASVLSLTAPAETLAAATALLAGAVRRPAFSARDWQIAVAETMDELAWREGDLADVAERTAEAALYPKLPGRAAIDRSFESVASITREEAQALHPQLFAPAATSFYTIGPAPLGDVVAALEQGFGDWESDAAPLPQVTLWPATFPARPRLLLAPEPGARRKVPTDVRPAPGMDEPGRSAAVAVFRVLAADFLSRLNGVIREEKGYSYGTGGDLLDVRRGGAISVSTAVELENTGEVLADIFAGFAGLGADPVRADELERTITAYRAALAGIGETAAGLFEDVMAQLGAGTTLEKSYARRVATTQLTLDAVRAEATKLSSLDNAVIVVVGDPAVRPQLEELGLDIELVQRTARPATLPAEPPLPPGPPSDLT
jgi:zinc protease